MNVIPMTIYLILFLIALIPPLIRFKPFTYYFSVNRYPKSITDSDTFIRINNKISILWAFLFAVAFVLVQIKYNSHTANNIIISNIAAILPQILIGIPASLLLPSYLMTRPEYKIRFNNLKDAFEALRYGLNRKAAKGVNIVVQFRLSGGDEEQISHIIIKDMKCEYNKTPHKNPPDVTIIADSNLWLNIINGDIDGDVAYLLKQYEIEGGDINIVLQLSKLFNSSAVNAVQEDRKQDYNYKTVQHRQIKDIVVFDGGVRGGKKYSKTTLMLDKFIEGGAENAGGHVKKHRLIDLNINQCTGCYTCWTKTPGLCIHNDDMHKLLADYSKAD